MILFRSILLRMRTVSDRIRGRGGEIFRTPPDWPWGPPSLLYNGYRVSFPEVKGPVRGVEHPSPSRAEVKKE
jgi:hypothetical protein